MELSCRKRGQMTHSEETRTLREKARRSLNEMNLIDNFMFEQCVSDEEYGEEFCRIILEIILGREMGNLKVTAQKTLPGIDSEYHGARIDAFIREKGNGTETDVISGDLYDIEPDKNAQFRRALPQRTRFYRAKLDSRALGVNKEYSEIVRSYVIMITDYDPFGKDRIIYTVKNRCLELPDMEYDDGAMTLYLYCRGHVGDVGEELKALLKFMVGEGTIDTDDSRLADLNRMLETVRHRERTEGLYMKWYEEIEIERRKAGEEGRAEGRAEGREEGRAEERAFMASFYSWLIENGRSDDVKRAAKDEAFMSKLIDEYRLTVSEQ